MNYRWTIEKQKEFPKKVFTYATTFSGAGGASLGMNYLNRYNNIFFNEIDPKQIELYTSNLESKYEFRIPIQELIQQDFSDKPDCLDLDILQASPPCTLYSATHLTADSKKGKAQDYLKESAGVNQVIDELYQPAIELCAKLSPKVFIIENVKGLTFKKNKIYVDDIYNRLNKIGYKVMHNVVNGKDMGMIQKRSRVFFVAIRKDLEFNGFNLEFDEPFLPISSIKHSDWDDRPISEKKTNTLKYYQEGDKDLGVINTREFGKRSGFSTNLPIEDRDVFNTITTKSDANVVVRINDEGVEFYRPTEQQLIQAQSFPLDYNFLGRSIYYPIGMSVAPLQIAKIVDRIEKHILVPYYTKNKEEATKGLQEKEDNGKY